MFPAHLLLLPGVFLLPGVLRVSGIDIYTPSEVEAINGTNVKLKCTFSSTQRVSLKSVTVSWNFRPLNSGTEESVFYYHEAPYPPMEGRFKGHAVWSGDIMRNDASITLHEVPPTFNGTFTCQVRNRPDVHGSNGELVLRVVNSAASFSEISILAIAVGSSCGVILIILCIVVAVRYCAKKSVEGDAEMDTRVQEWRDPTVCLPEEMVHLTAVVKKKEVDSSDGEESEPSSGDDEEEEEGEEDDDDDDDDDDDGDDD